MSSIAIVAWGGIFPQGANAAKLWSHLRRGGDASTDPPGGRWCLEPQTIRDHPDMRVPTQDRVRSTQACFVEDDQALRIDGHDPIAGWYVAAARQAWAQTVTDKIDPKRVAVFIGNIMLPIDHSTRWTEHVMFPRLESALGFRIRGDAPPPRAAQWNSGGMAGLVSQTLGWGGPHLTLDAACASSYFALALAARALERGEVDAVVAGGGSRADSLYTQVGFSQLRALSSRGRCSPFDHRADGLVVGEGVGLFVLKRLADARRDGDAIAAVLRGIGLSNDVDGALLAPNEDGQVRAIEAAFREAGWSPGDIDLVECHATGTPLGDAVEFGSLCRVWATDHDLCHVCALGAVKANVGHLLTGAGAAGLAKVLLSFRHHEIPPVANYEAPASRIALDGSPFHIPTVAEPWPTRRRAPRAALSGFGFGGTNAHLLLEAGDGDEPSRVQILVPSPTDPVQIAIVGYAARVGTWDTEALTAALRDRIALPEEHRSLGTLGVPIGVFRIPPRELQRARPQQLVMLQLAAEALHGVRRPGDPGSQGVILGTGLDPVIHDDHLRWRVLASGNEWAKRLGIDPVARDTWVQALADAASLPLDPDRTLGGLASIAASRIAHEFGFGGPAFVLSSEECGGLSALARAVAALRQGDLELALVGAVECGSDPRTPHCGTDAGIVWVLKPLAAARRDGDHVFASIEGIAETTGGVPGETSPPVEAQVQTIEAALRCHRHSADRVSRVVAVPAATPRDRARQTRALSTAYGEATEEPLPAWIGTCGHARGLVAAFAALETAKYDSDRSTIAVHAVSSCGATAHLLLAWVPPLIEPPTGADALVTVEAVTTEALDAAATFIEVPGHTSPFAAIPPIPRRPHPDPIVRQPPVDSTPPTPVRSSTLTSDIALPILQLATATAAAHAAYLQLSRTRLALLGRVEQLPALDRAACLAFAVGKIGEVLGPDFAQIDLHPTRVRLPDEPLMLVDRILTIEGEPRSLTHGRAVTEHDVHEHAWYLDSRRIPTCIAVEAGQADLFLSAYLGIDEKTRGVAMYRLLDATIEFHAPLPGPGATIHYDIHIERFFRQGDTWLFRFAFDSTVDGAPLMTMRDGCAGFFTAAQLAAGKGIVPHPVPPTSRPSPIDPRTRFLRMPDAPLDRGALDALRRGELATAFGERFADIPLSRPLTIPEGRMALLDRVTEIELEGGPWKSGRIYGEYDLHADDWFLACHFVDDEVMPGTLMYECCLHTLRVFLLRLGWLGERDTVAFEPVCDVKSRLECRGQVVPQTTVVGYEILIRELGFETQGGAPYAIADALMYADGRPIVRIIDMSVRLSGSSLEQLEMLHETRDLGAPRPAIYDRDKILAFAEGLPSEAFGAPYRIFDAQRRIARLPRPPFALIDRITELEGQPFVMRAGARAQAQFELRPDAWFFDSARQRTLPFAILLEIALQPCGWLAAYVGSALQSSVDLRFRNLGGEATLLAPVDIRDDLITTDVRLDRVSHSGGMIIQHYTFECTAHRRGAVYRGTTYFGYFSDQALSDQVGLSDALSPLGAGPTPVTRLPIAAPFPDARLRMIDAIEALTFDGPPHGLGRVRGSIRVNPAAWFFAAHFYQDPVWPGSLGLQAFLQLLQLWLCERSALPPQTVFAAITTAPAHRWEYRGQVIPSHAEVVVEANITRVDDRAQRVWAEGTLWVDGRPIYAMREFGMEVHHE